VKPINSKDRNKAIFQFTILLLITICIVIMAVFFDHKVPLKENAYLRSKMKNTEYLVSMENDFALKMERIKSLIDSMDAPGVNSDYISQLISTRLAEMQTTMPPDSTFRRMMYNNIIQSYLELKNAKAALIQLNDVQTELDEYSQLIEQYKTDLAQSQRDLDLCRRLSY